VSSSSDPVDADDPSGPGAQDTGPDEPPSPRKPKKRALGETLGGVIVGFDYQVFRATRPPTELVESAKPVAPVAASDGGNLSIELPDEPRGDPPTPTADPEP
jgi:hypothetical protein